MRRKAYYAEFGKERQKPGFKAQMIAFFIRILPKIGPLKAFKFKDPGPDGEKLFVNSFDTVLVHYAAALARLKHGNIILQNVDYDTGKPTIMGEYGLADKAYDNLVTKLQENKFEDLTLHLKQNILAFYNSADTLKMAKNNADGRKKTYVALLQVKKAPAIRIDSLKTAKGINYKAHNKGNN